MAALGPRRGLEGGRRRAASRPTRRRRRAGPSSAIATSCPTPSSGPPWRRHDAAPAAPRPTLITDFYSYNTNVSSASTTAGSRSTSGWLQPNWVGDLTLSGRVDLDVGRAGGRLKLELVEAGVSNRCEVDLITGLATLYHGDDQARRGRRPILQGVGAHDVEFANVDDRLTLWVDGATPFDDGLTYDDGPTAPYAPTAADLDPVGVAIRGARARRERPCPETRYLLYPGPERPRLPDPRRPRRRSTATSRASTAGSSRCSTSCPTRPGSPP